MAFEFGSLSAARVRRALRTIADGAEALATLAAPKEAGDAEVRLWDSQWMNVVNHADCYRDMDKDDAVATAVRMTERIMAENITRGFPPPRRLAAPSKEAVPELFPGTYESLSKLSIRQENPDEL